MTIEEIKEYAHTIAEYIKNYREVCREEGGDEERIPTTPLQNDIEHLVSMLDDLDRPNEVKLMCPRCKHEWQKPITEFCGKCGETMEVIEIYYTKGENRSEL